MRSVFQFGLVSITTLAEIRALFSTIVTDVMLACPDQNVYCGQNIEMLADYKGRLTLRSVKLVMDGALGSWGAAMVEVLFHC